MCFKTPKINPEADARRKQAEAAALANAEAAYRKSKGLGMGMTAAGGSSRGVTGAATTSSALASGKTQLGA